MSPVAHAGDAPKSYIGCIGEIEGGPLPKGKWNGCFRNGLRPPQLSFWKDCNFARAHPVFTDEYAAANFCQTKGLWAVFPVPRMAGWSADYCGYIIDRVTCVPPPWFIWPPHR